MADNINEPNSPKEKQFDDKKKQGGQGGQGQGAQGDNPGVKKEFSGQEGQQGKKNLEGNQGSNIPRETRGSSPGGEKSYGEEGGGGMESDVNKNRETGSGGDEKPLNT